MWTAIVYFIMTYLDPIGVVVGLIVSVPIVWTWWEISFGRRRKQRRWLREVRKQPGRRHGILIVDLLDKRDISTAIEKFRQQDSELKQVPKERIFSITRKKRTRPEHMPSLIEEIQGTAAKVLSNGVDTLHYFHAGPAMIAAITGAQFANSCRVFLYQYNPASGSYESYGPMRLEE